ncbi:hypothetical protein EDEG_03171 [Edhazardia aedis USNM 41457]|uniref:DUF1764 domain-containing protein n=1 Tax=Edhazardia aedis (strain USNM 41457) TaxID=1003232 RepID=J9DLZ1_EDHAE|nr:hypothetical protein EDEG_03171 [Edhazardia aedis USNM 41457]|eukprot:EJW02402.1 hypothetical protein EDEG_03171 [Edhazardia aedis USNM 41457]
MSKIKNDIDNIFDNSTVKKSQNKKNKKDKKNDEVDSDEDFSLRGKEMPRKYTEDGFPIYSLKELGLGNSQGETELCPFDCDCCH